MLAYLSKRLPLELAKSVYTVCQQRAQSAQSARRFCANYKAHPDSSQHFSVDELVDDPDLWLVSTNEGKKRQSYLQSVYPKHVKPKVDIPRSILKCGQCKKHTVDYFEMQTRGADEPMTCFCECLSCGNRWRQ